jgi:hypothetical protein
MVTGIADKAFRGIRTADELLDKRPPKGREHGPLNGKRTYKPYQCFAW